MGCGVSSMMNGDGKTAPPRILSQKGKMNRPIKDRNGADNDYPGSPSFRFYFSPNDGETIKNNEDEIGGDKSTSSSSSTSSYNSKGSKKEKNKEGKKSSFRPKQLLNIRSCCSAPDVNFLRLPEKSPS